MGGADVKWQSREITVATPPHSGPILLLTLQVNQMDGDARRQEQAKRPPEKGYLLTCQIVLRTSTSYTRDLGARQSKQSASYSALYSLIDWKPPPQTVTQQKKRRKVRA